MSTRDTSTQCAGVIWQVPPSVLRWLDDVPRDVPVALLLRHSVRPPLPDNETGVEVRLTEEGVALAESLGAHIGARLASAHTSPVPRCVQTVDALIRGAGVGVSVEQARLLGDPTVFVHDAGVAWRNWKARGHEWVMARLCEPGDALPGMARPAPAARHLVRSMLASGGDTPGVHVFSTHDSVIAAVASQLLGEVLPSSEWPWFLEGAFFWRDGKEVRVAWRDRVVAVPADTLMTLDDEDVLEFARRELTWALGAELPGRVFFAGGAFKSLLTGRPPRDLDLWAPSEADRAAIVARIEARGGQRQTESPFNEAWRLGERVVELSRKVAPDTLEARLARFDIALAAVGVEYDGRGRWRAVVDPRARESAARREVQMLLPLVNKSYALTSLERARRYARELGYVLPRASEEACWAVFAAGGHAEREDLIERLSRTTRSDEGVAGEARRRLAALEDVA